MAWYAYCLIEQASLSPHRLRRPFPLEGLHGISGAQVFAFPSGDLAVIVSEFVHGNLDERSGYEHAHVIAECFHRGTVLPLRFGSVFENDEEVRHAVRANRRLFLESVSLLRGKSEMHIKVTVHDAHVRNDTEMPTTRGMEYLAKLREKAVSDREVQTRARTVTTHVHKLFNPLQEEIVCKKVPSGALTINIAHLVENSEVAKYQSRSTAASRQLPNCEVAVSGPWPPYHFMPGKVRTVS